jgi:HAD superfamily phosphoserine phosphatase-like hydrolase
MDNTLLNGRFIDTCAKHYGFKNDLLDLRTSKSDPVILTKRIVVLLKGKTQTELLGLANSIPLVPDAAEVVGKLKKRGYLTDIISDSYLLVANLIKQKAGIDFALANELEFSKGICTGGVKLPSFFFNNPKSICKHPMCKTNAVLTLLEKHNLSIENTIDIGDSHNDLCMIKQAGLGMAFRSKDELLYHYADITVDDNSFAILIDEAR